MQSLNYLFHLVAYYLAWAICILLAAHNYPWLSTAIVLGLVTLQIIWQFKVKHDTHGLFILIGLLSIIGALTDTLLLHLNLIQLASNPFAPYFTAPWMISIWISFAVIFFSTLRGLFKRYLLLGILAVFGFPFAYYIGVKLGAASFPKGLIACLVIGILWGVLLPLCTYTYQTLVGDHA